MPVSGGSNVKRILSQQQNPSGEVTGIQVGFFGTDKYPDGTAITTVAAVHEYGLGGIPERPFFRVTVSESKEDVRQLLRERVDPASMTVTPQDAEIIGAFIARRIESKITALKTPPLAPSTRRGRDGDNPLLDSGRLAGHVRYERI